jgi:hypothetical protein
MTTLSENLFELLIRRKRDNRDCSGGVSPLQSSILCSDAIKSEFHYTSSSEARTEHKSSRKLSRLSSGSGRESKTKADRGDLRADSFAG